MRQRVKDLGLDTWFQPSVERAAAGRRPTGQLGEDPVIQRGDVLHCDFGVTALRLNTDTQHMGYVLREGETDVPAGLKAALKSVQPAAGHRVRGAASGPHGQRHPARLARERMRAEGIDGTVYSHPIGLHGHGAGPMVGLWDRQEGVPGNGDHKVIANQWYSVELQATSPVPEWNGQLVRSAQEEDVTIDADGRVHWAHRRQETFHLVR